MSVLAFIRNSLNCSKEVAVLISIERAVLPGGDTLVLLGRLSRHRLEKGVIVFVDFFEVFVSLSGLLKDAIRINTTLRFFPVMSFGLFAFSSIIKDQLAILIVLSWFLPFSGPVRIVLLYKRILVSDLPVVVQQLRPCTALKYSISLLFGHVALCTHRIIFKLFAVNHGSYVFIVLWL